MDNVYDVILWAGIALCLLAILAGQRDYFNQLWSQLSECVADWLGVFKGRVQAAAEWVKEKLLQFKDYILSFFESTKPSGEKCVPVYTGGVRPVFPVLESETEMRKNLQSMIDKAKEELEKTASDLAKYKTSLQDTPEYTTEQAKLNSQRTTGFFGALTYNWYKYVHPTSFILQLSDPKYRELTIKQDKAAESLQDLQKRLYGYATLSFEPVAMPPAVKSKIEKEVNEEATNLRFSTQTILGALKEFTIGRIFSGYSLRGAYIKSRTDKHVAEWVIKATAESAGTKHTEGAYVQGFGDLDQICYLAANGP